jgi:hypothetical protein
LFKDKKYRVEIDAGEIVDFKDESDFLEYVDYLANSGNFENTHSCISVLSDFKKFLSDEEIEKILESAVINTQINLIIEDSDVKEFIGSLYTAKKNLMTPELRQYLNFGTYE